MVGTRGEIRDEELLTRGERADLQVESADARMRQENIAVRMPADEQNLLCLRRREIGTTVVDDEYVFENRAVF